MFLAATLASAATTQPATQPGTPPQLYVVGYAHLDTQWRWSYPQVISEFLQATLKDNFALFAKYPDYIFNFTGANRYMLFKEYYPEQFETLRGFVKAGRWFPAGSSMEEGDVDMPGGEALIRQVLYGNQFFRHEFGKASAEFMLPDSFGFQASLPSILAHCGLKGFSTQKLSWSSAVGIPFNIGVWEGPDGKGIVAAFNPGSYTSTLKDDLSASQEWQQRLDEDAMKTGVPVDYRYYGVGDRGGAPSDDSLRSLEASLHGAGPLKIISATAEQMFLDLTKEQIEKLPRYRGDLLLTNHSAGSVTSQAYIKRLNRKNEALAQSAEHAASIAHWLGTANYPGDTLASAWRFLLAAHFHDIMAGTALPKCYEYSWNDLILSLNKFAAVTEDSVSAIATSMNTNVPGTPLVVFNPLSVARDDIVEADIVNAFGTSAIKVQTADGKDLPTQTSSAKDGKTHIAFRAHVEPMSVTVFSITGSAGQADNEIHVSDRSIENDKLRVTIDENGDIASIYDKSQQREALRSPARLVFLSENPEQYPAWNMDWKDRQQPPRAVVSGPCKVRIVERGPARGAIEVSRDAEGSHFVQTIRLASGAAGDRVEVAAEIDWRTRGSSLKAEFPLVAENAEATYESQSAAVRRGTNNPKKFESPQQRWFDLTDKTESGGVAILNDCKYGSDKPDDHTVRLTLLYTPGVRRDYQDQATQDLGHHQILYAIVPHAGGWQQANIPAQAERLNQPLIPFTTPKHDGPLGSTFSAIKLSSDHVTTMAFKKCEESGDLIVRFNETHGQPEPDLRATVLSGIESAVEVDGQEREIGPATVRDGVLVTDLPQFGLRAFKLHLRGSSGMAPSIISTPISLPFDLDVVSSREHLSDGAFDAAGHTYPAESFPKTLHYNGVTYELGPVEQGHNNALTCRGQMIELPENSQRLELLAAATGGDATGEFLFDGHSEPRTIQDWCTYIGLWDNRQWHGQVSALTYKWRNPLAGVAAGFIKRDPVAWHSTQRHDPVRGSEYYQFTYLFNYRFDLPAGAKQMKLPDNPRIRIFAATAVQHPHDSLTPAAPLYDLLDHQISWTEPPPASMPATTQSDDDD